MNKKNLIEYISSSKRKNSELSLYHISVVIKDPIRSKDWDISSFIEDLKEVMPQHLLESVEMIYIGKFPVLTGRNAAYTDGAIYITNEEPTLYDMLENVIHEIAHSLEPQYGEIIFSDALKSEFLSKRLKLKSILEANGYVTSLDYKNMEYSRPFDTFLSQEVGYPTLLSLTMGLFISPYGATSLQEYFANGFEKYYLGDAEVIKDISPVLYNVLNTLHAESND